MNILWKVDRMDLRRASVRYRACYPTLQLEKMDCKVTITDSINIGLTDLREFDCIVISKSFQPDSLALGSDASLLGIPYILDLCDNIFFPDYGMANGAKVRSTFLGLALNASVVVVPTPSLANVVRAHVPQGTPIEIIVDPLETPGLVAELFNKRVWKLKADEKSEYISLKMRIVGILRTFWAKTRMMKSLMIRDLLKSLITFSKIRTTRQLGFIAKRMNIFLDRSWFMLRKRVLASWHFCVDYGRVIFPRPNLIVRAIGKRIAKKMLEWEVSLPIEPLLPPEDRKTVLWFGFHGGPYSDFGMITLAYLKTQLIAVNKRIPIRLLVISNDVKKFNHLFGDFPLPSEYREWTLRGVFRDIAECDVCILPNSQDPFSQCKSANRAVLALSLGVPVIATWTQALDPFKGLIMEEDWEASLYTYLNDSGRAVRDVGAAQRVIARQFRLEAVAGQWLHLLEDVISRKMEKPAEIVFFMDLVQDLDVVLPIAVEAAAREDMCVRAWVTENLIFQSPRVIQQLHANGITITVIPRRAVISNGWLSATMPDAIVTASESTAGPHRASHALVKYAKSLGISTYTMQHGLENIGLTYVDSTYDMKVRFASDRIFIWGPIESLHADIVPETRNICVSVGCPKTVIKTPLAELPIPEHHGPVVAVFENLHWERYSKEYVERFLADLRQAISDTPDTLFILKPHHAGNWFAKSYNGPAFDFANLIIAAPDDPLWEPFTAPDLINASDAVITTPSTVALDAARAGCPVAVVGYDLDLSVYEPLSVLRGGEDWARFVDGVGQGEESLDKSKAQQFVDRTILPGDAVARILNTILEDFETTPESEAPAKDELPELGPSA